LVGTGMAYSRTVGKEIRAQILVDMINLLTEEPRAANVLDVANEVINKTTRALTWLHGIFS
jgi:hypothetical protein